eukprot:2369814-Pyramimonas_sp.AAC.1
MCTSCGRPMNLFRGEGWVPWDVVKRSRQGPYPPPGRGSNKAPQRAALNVESKQKTRTERN